MDLTYFDDRGRLRNSKGQFAKFSPDETCPNGCERYGDWWVPEDCLVHLRADMNRDDRCDCPKCESCDERGDADHASRRCPKCADDPAYSWPPIQREAIDGRGGEGL